MFGLDYHKTKQFALIPAGPRNAWWRCAVGNIGSDQKVHPLVGSTSRPSHWSVLCPDPPHQRILSTQSHLEQGRPSCLKATIWYMSVRAANSLPNWHHLQPQFGSLSGSTQASLAHTWLKVCWRNKTSAGHAHVVPLGLLLSATAFSNQDANVWLRQIFWHTLSFPVTVSRLQRFPKQILFARQL